jgi:hypothetical protein
MAENWMTKIHGDHFYPLMHMSTFHTTLHATPRQLVFGVWKRNGTAQKRYGRLGGQLNNNAKKRWTVIIRRDNASRISHDYNVGYKVLLKKPGKYLRKLEAPRTCPHKVTVININGTLHIQKGKISKRVNIRRLFPYFENADH